MAKNVVYERDLLYPTENISEPGSIHIELMNPTKGGKMPVIVEGKTQHSPISYIDAVVRVMQSDIFDRILVDIKSNVRLYIKVDNGMKKEFANCKYALVVFENSKIGFMGVNEIEE